MGPTDRARSYDPVGPGLNKAGKGPLWGSGLFGPVRGVLGVSITARVPGVGSVGAYVLSA